MYEQAGCGASDMDFVQLYDDYPVMEYLQLEGLKFCGRGGAADLIRQGCGPINSLLPINTGGGQLSAGQAGVSGGMIGVFEAITPLQVRTGVVEGKRGSGRGDYGEGR